MGAMRRIVYMQRIFLAAAAALAPAPARSASRGHVRLQLPAALGS